MRVRRPTSKRQSTKMREGIKKKAAASRKKQKKLAKTDVTWTSRAKKSGRIDISDIPNSFPYKNKIIEELAREKEVAKEERERRRKEAKAARQKATLDAKVTTEADDEMFLNEDDVEESEEEMEIDEGGEMNALMDYARRAAKNYVEDDHDEDGSMVEDDDEDEEEDESDGDDEGWSNVAGASEGSRKSFDKVFKSVVDAADVILYVLDARDPESTRSREVEKLVLSTMEKRLIFVLNKVDLVPADVQKAWETYLRNFFPTISVRATSAAPNAQQLNHKSVTPQSTASTLLRSLKTYAAKANLKRAIVVGVIGYPNVGKSSVINALTSRLGGRTAACPVGAEAGITTSLREVKIDSKLKLLDSPGIVFPTESSTSNEKSDSSSAEARLLLLGALPPKQITDAVPAVSLLLQKLEQVPALFEALKQYYDLPSLLPRIDANTGKLDKSTDFLVHVARKRGRIGKGGIPNLQAAAMAVINDWRDGRIQRWVMPPEFSAADNSGVTVLRNVAGKNVERKDIVQQWAEEFSLDGLWNPGEDEEIVD